MIHYPLLVLVLHNHCFLKTNMTNYCNPILTWGRGLGQDQEWINRGLKRSLDQHKVKQVSFKFVTARCGDLGKPFTWKKKKRWRFLKTAGFPELQQASLSHVHQAYVNVERFKFGSHPRSETAFKASLQTASRAHRGYSDRWYASTNSTHLAHVQFTRACTYRRFDQRVPLRVLGKLT